MTEDSNYLDMAQDFDIVYSQVENEQIMDSWAYQLDAVADHFTSYFE